ncbi:hypothetical protein ACFFRR_000426 [Megaselia abdita]
MSSEQAKKIGWYWGLVFPVACFALFYAAVFPSYYYFPDVLKKGDEDNHKGKFIGERAEETLLELTAIGEKIVGSREHQIAIEYLYRKVENIRNNSRLDLYEIEIDKQIVSGKFNFGRNFKYYQDLTNIVIKVSPLNVKTENALLINSHYDSEIGSPGAGDAGIMIACMLETFRVIAKDDQPLDHTVIFLLNGSEENGLLAAHGFITSHKWAKYAKALINLDSAGNGGREILFQSGPNHPWLMKYYRKSVRYPFASTMAEELFQNNFIPSDTDFRIFRDYGKVPGLDMAHSYNGYVYHTKYDRFSVLTKGTYQLTGTNILALTRSLANAPELDDTKAHEEGHTVFYDMAGWFMVFYTETQGIIINSLVSVIGLTLIGIFIYITQKDTQVTYKNIAKTFGCIFLIQFLSFVLAVVANILVALFLDAVGLSLSWYSNLWILFGLYFCPFFFVLGIGQSVLFSLKFMKNQNLSNYITTQMMMHSQCIILILLLIIMTGLGIRSSFAIMVSVFFYIISTAINLVINRFYKNELLWTIPHCLCQLLPFWFYTYLCYAILITFIPMQGRSGSNKNPEMIISLFIAVFAFLFSGFLIPLFNMCRKTKLLFSSFGVLTIVFIIIAATPAGFPFKADTAPQRYGVRHTNRVFYDFNGNIRRQDSGYALSVVDRRYSSTQKYITDFDKRLNMKEECANELNVYCGIPIYRAVDSDSSNFIPGPMAILPEEKLSVTLVSRESIGNLRKFSIGIKASDHTTILLNFKNGTILKSWSMAPDTKTLTSEPPFVLNTFYGLEFKDITFDMEFEREGPENSTTLQMVVVAHYVHHTNIYTEEFNKFIDAFPNWTYVNHWLSDYQSYEF